MILDEDYWATRYKENRIKWDIGEVSTPIKEYINQLEDKSLRILIPGSGNSYEAEYLHDQGFSNVFVVDIAREPLDNLKNRIPSFPKEHLLQKDFFDLNLQFDLILEQTFFCALSIDLRQKYAEKMIELLKTNGQLVGLFFNFELTKSGPPFGGSQEEYKDLFQPYFEILKLENCYNSITPRSGNELFFIFKKIK
ncbi:methyltransferase domain-containing protein [Gillisia hiemivivida]|uniref:Methyltransferase domain-containing protein n=1 Tax=Gillisia hiemivivida TaxID=291190 RepID=A0A5C6ZQJ2_9FLAO|nr:methyltransferase domain-containing protein [Gillisia hiemivivida]TXD91805.1 methyltransferase domain-containing protein [Gillisia hiemivivida]